MADFREEFRQGLRDYIGRIKGAASHTAKEYIFIDFVRSAFDINLDQYEIEKHVYRGRIDAILGSLVFEIKMSLSRELEDAQSQLKRYITELRKAHPSATYTAIATDGILFKVFAPVYLPDGIQVRELEPIGELNIEATDVEPKAVFFWLDSLLFLFQQVPITPTAQSMVAHLGSASPTFASANWMLHNLFQEVAPDPFAKVRLEEWGKYLAIVYGEETKDPKLFLRHTYLATLAKLIVYFRLESHPLPIDIQRVGEIVTGAYFQRSGIINFIEDDFFTWFLHPKVKERGLNLINKLIYTLGAYDFKDTKEDVLKSLYQELVDPETRHDLGEYYTPDWLAHYMLSQEVKVGENPQISILDPGCGSGTFLFMAIRLMKDALLKGGMAGGQVLEHIRQRVVGIDVHPIAVTIARTNYILALGELLRERQGVVSIPVYLANSIRLPKSTSREPMGGYEEDVYTLEEGDETFEFPGSLVANPNLLDAAVESMRQLVTRKESEEELLKAFRNSLASLGISTFAIDILCRDMKTVLKLYREGKDTIWLFIMKNAPKPAFLRQNKFDAVVGNPPWLSMRYIKSPDYAQFVKGQVIKKYRLLASRKTHLFTHLELATLFFVRTADLYLRDQGIIAFVMPRSVLVSDQHAEFTTFTYEELGTLSLSLNHILDLEQVSPLFNIPACVLVAQKGAWTKYPVQGLSFQGELPSKNAKWAEAKPRLKIQPLSFRRVEGKLFSSEASLERERMLGRSYYADKFYQGATIVPRNFWFVQVQVSPALGFNPQMPYLVRAEDVAANAKKPWKDVHLKGSVEAQFLYGTLIGGDIVPFGYQNLRPVVLPIAKAPSTLVPKSLLLNKASALEQGFHGLAQWLTQAEQEWADKAKRDEKGNLKSRSAVEWLDYRLKLTKQLTSRRYKVLYTTSGTNISSTVVEIDKLPPLEVGGAKLHLQGFVADTKSYYYDTDSQEEAHYLAAILNSSVVDSLIKPLQPRGLWGERDIHKKPLAVRIPQFNTGDKAHQALARLSIESHRLVEESLPELAKKYRSTAKLRGEIRRLLRSQLKAIEQVVPHVLTKSLSA